MISLISGKRKLSHRINDLSRDVWLDNIRLKNGEKISSDSYSDAEEGPRGQQWTRG
jgi:hypothetical protein